MISKAWDFTKLCQNIEILWDIKHEKLKSTAYIWLGSVSQNSNKYSQLYFRRKLNT
jgi:hypothetical protein